MARFKHHLYQPMELGMRVVLDVQAATPQAAGDHVERLITMFGMSRATAYRMVALSAYVLNRELPMQTWDKIAERAAATRGAKGTRPGKKRTW